MIRTVRSVISEFLPYEQGLVCIIRPIVGTCSEDGQPSCSGIYESIPGDVCTGFRQDMNGEGKGLGIITGILLLTAAIQ